MENDMNSKHLALGDANACFYRRHDAFYRGNLSGEGRNMLACNQIKYLNHPTSRSLTFVPMSLIPTSYELDPDIKRGALFRVVGQFIWTT